MSIVDHAAVEQALMRELEDDERPWIQAQIDYLESLIALRSPEILDEASQGGAMGVVLRFIVGEAVARVMRSPSGGLYRYETEGTYTYSINQAVASGVLELTDRDWGNLQSAGSGFHVHNPTYGGYARRRVQRYPIGVPIPFGHHSQMNNPDPAPLESGVGPVTDVDLDVWGEY